MDNETLERWRIRAFHATEDVKRALGIQTLEDEVCEHFLIPVVQSPQFNKLVSEVISILTGKPLQDE